MLRKCVFLSLIMVMILSLFACGPKEVIPDLNLEAAIREAIGKSEGSIFASDLEGLTTLDASKRGITDLAGLERCTNLTVLWL